MRRIVALSLLVLVLPLALPAGDFEWMVREFSRQSGVQQTHIPFFGLARFVVAVAHPAGTSELNLAVFERPHIQPRDFTALTDSVTGAAWKPMIRVRSQNGDTTNIYLRPDGKHLKLIVATLDGSEATFVELRLRPESLMSFVQEHRTGHASRNPNL